MKKLFFFGLITLMFAACQQPKDQFVINGTIAGLDSGKVYLRNKKTINDSAEIKDGKFQFKGTIESPVNVTLFTPASRYNFFIEPATMTFTATTADKKNFELTGSVPQEEWAFLNAELQPYKDSYKTISTKEQEDSITNLIQTRQAEFIKANPDSYISLVTIPNMLWEGLSPETARTLYNTLSEKQKTSAEGKEVDENITRYDAVQIGKIAPDFALPDTTGTNVSLSSLRGKYVLVDFWASWCGPCRYENPNVVKAFNEFKDKNFTVLGVSLDSKKEKWEEAILADGLTWTHVSDLKGWESAAGRLYNIFSIPSNVLLDPDGKIIDKNLRGEKLSEKLKEILK